MRKLIYIPVIHSGADMGSMAAELTRKAKAQLSDELWETHIANVTQYWDRIEHYCDTLGIGKNGIKIYQDSMVADGEAAMKIMADNVKKGSRNYEIISKLVSRGAVIIKTEDFKFVKKELELLKSIPASNLLLIKILKILIFRLKRAGLLRKRDKYIASRIAETLKPGETGILFLGAYHNILKMLPDDLQVIEFKKVDKIREYQKLVPLQSVKKLRFQHLSEYLKNT